MRKNCFRLTLCAMLFALCSSAVAQQPGKVPRIGFLLLLLATGSIAESQNTARVGLLLPQSASSEPDRSRIKAFQQGLAEIGYFEGKNLTIEYRSAEGRLDHLPALAAELVALKVDVIVTGGNESIRAVQNKTSTIPVVMAFGGDLSGAALWPTWLDPEETSQD